MQIFCETEEEYRKTIDNIQSVLGMNERALTNRISLEKKVEILYKINNKNRRIDNEKLSFSNKNLISKIRRMAVFSLKRIMQEQVWDMRLVFMYLSFRMP